VSVLRAIMAKLLNGIVYILAFIVMGFAVAIVALLHPIETARAIKAAVWE